MTGHIQRRGSHSWRLKFEMGTDALGKRKTHFKTVRGTKRDAEIELARLVTAAQKGDLVDPSRATVDEFLTRWLRDWATPNASPKTVERWSELLRLHVLPHIGTLALQRLNEGHLTTLYARLVRAAPDGSGLAARTVKHIHSALYGALKCAVRWRLLNANPATGMTLPKVEEREMNILDSRQVEELLQYLRTCNSEIRRGLYLIVAIAVTTGLRRGEIAALTWKNVDLASASLRVVATVEELKGQKLRLKSPKSKAGRRTVSLPAFVVAGLRAHWTSQQQKRLALGLGKAPDDSPVFARDTDGLLPPSYITGVWRDITEDLGLAARFHDLRHTHASQLIASKLDIITISRRLGHSKPSTTLNVYGHLWGSGDTQAAQIMEAAFSPRTE